MLSPGRWDAPPSAIYEVWPVDTGGGYRPDFRPQAPHLDPREPQGGEGSAKGAEHGWNNCTMSAGALALAYEFMGAREPWGGDMRHRQDDLDGGTDLRDLKQAWAAFGKLLHIRSGDGWEGVVQAHAEGRPIVVQGIGNVPGSNGYTGAHACIIGPESRGTTWLWGDTLTSGWQWVERSAIRAWVERFDSQVQFAVGRSTLPPEPPVPPQPIPVPPPPVLPIPTVWSLAGALWSFPEWGADRWGLTRWGASWNA